MKHMNIAGAFSRMQIKKIKPRENSILISVTDSDESHTSLEGQWKSILRLKFDDIHVKSLNEGKFHLKGMTDNDARKILDFVMKHKECDIYVNCEAGISRSTGIVVALEALFNNKDFSEVYPCHNPFVREKILKQRETIRLEQSK